MKNVTGTCPTGNQHTPGLASVLLFVAMPACSVTTLGEAKMMELRKSVSGNGEKGSCFNSDYSVIKALTGI